MSSRSNSDWELDRIVVPPRLGAREHVDQCRARFVAEALSFCHGNVQAEC
jgi:hypothetical protein